LNTEALRTLLELVEAPVCLVISPARDGTPVPKAIQEQIDAVRQVHSRLEYVNLNEALQSTDDWFMDHVHLSAQGHTAVAEALADMLGEAKESAQGGPSSTLAAVDVDVDPPSE
jgi:lysophospholipase L1-like esterase